MRPSNLGNVQFYIRRSTWIHGFVFHLERMVTEDRPQKKM